MIRFIVFILLCSSIAIAEVNTNKSLELNEQGVAAVHEKDFDDAEELFLEALNEDPYNLTAVFNLAGMYLSTEQNENAVKLLKHYTKQYPADAGLQARLGDSYFASQKVKEATESYNKSLKLDKTTKKIHGKLGTAYTLLNDLKNAEKHYELAVQEEPLNYDYLSSLSSLQLGNGNTTDAIRTAKKALQVKASSEVYITLGTTYELDKNYANSLIAFQRAQDLGDARVDLAQKIDALKAKTNS